MDDRKHDALADRFEAERRRLRAVAYRMLGSLADADDAVQECWLRLSRADTSSIESLGAWLTTVVGRVCFDMLRARQSRREESLANYESEPGTGQRVLRSLLPTGKCHPCRVRRCKSEDRTASGAEIFWRHTRPLQLPSLERPLLALLFHLLQ